MKVTVIGSGYVGLVTAACLAEMGNHVVCLDVDAQRVAVLQSGGMPIHEPGLLALVRTNREAGRLQFTTDVAAATQHGTVQIIGVGTPPDEDGSADVSHVLAAARSIGRHMTDYKVVVTKSTVPVGTGERVQQAVRAELQARGAAIDFAIASNPEFLKEGAAVNDFLRPDRIIVGSDDERATLLLRALYTPFIRNHDRMLVMDVRSAEFTKYAANAMLASRISFMNELALLADRLDVDIELVRQGIGSDPRIGYSFLYAGAGYGGSCFPKDVKALIRMGEEHGSPMRILPAVEQANERQKGVLAERIVEHFGPDLRGRRFALWGLAFKPNTDDMREAPSETLIRELAARGARIAAYDPIAMDSARARMGDVDALSFADDAQSALAGCDALVLVTEWKEFKSPDFEAIGSALAERVVFDGRNLYDPALLRALGFTYIGIGRRS